MQQRRRPSLPTRILFFWKRNKKSIQQWSLVFCIFGLGLTNSVMYNSGVATVGLLQAFMGFCLGASFKGLRR